MIFWEVCAAGRGTNYMGTENDGTMKTGWIKLEENNNIGKKKGNYLTIEFDEGQNIMRDRKRYNQIAIIISFIREIYSSAPLLSHTLLSPPSTILLLARKSAR